MFSDLTDCQLAPSAAVGGDVPAARLYRVARARVTWAWRAAGAVPPVTVRVAREVAKLKTTQARDLEKLFLEERGKLMGEVRDAVVFKTKNGSGILVSRNNAEAVFYKLVKPLN